MRRRLFWAGVACALLALAALGVALGAVDRFHRRATMGRRAMRGATPAAVATLHGAVVVGVRRILAPTLRA